MRRTAVIVGASFWISNLATLVGSLVSGPIPNAPNSLTTMYPHATVIVVGTLIAHINDAAIIGYAVLLFPVLKRYSEGLALGYVAFKGLEATMLVVGAAMFPSLIALSQKYLASGGSAASFQASAKCLSHNSYGQLGWLPSPTWWPLPSSRSCCIGPGSYHDSFPFGDSSRS